MSPDLLMVAFALTLAVNAVFVIIAIRALRRGHFGPDVAPTGRETPIPPSRPPVTRAGRGVQPDVVRAVAARRAALRAALPDRAPVAKPAAEVPAGVEGAAETVVAGQATPTDEPSVADTSGHDEVALPSRDDVPAAAAGGDPSSEGRPAPTATTRSESIDRPPPAAVAAETSRKARGKGRRKFSLPPLDDDHEKVSRSIESFLSGGDAAGETGPGSVPEPAGGAATTVAMIAIVGVEAQGSPDDEAAAAMVERTLRSAARGTDSVEIDDRQRFRIVLPGTGELATRAYLRRVRATVEPLLEAARSPLRLVIATATVLDEPADAAAAVAGRRLDVAIAAARAGNEDEAAPDTRAAAD